MFSLNVFLPNSLSLNSSGSIRGCTIRIPENLRAIYILEDDVFLENSRGFEAIAGDVHCEAEFEPPASSFKNYIGIRVENGIPNISHLRIDNNSIDVDESVPNKFIIFYDRSAFAKAESLFCTGRRKLLKNLSESDYSNQFQALKTVISPRKPDFQSMGDDDSRQNYNIIVSTMIQFIYWLSAYSNVFNHIYNTSTLISFCVSSARRDRKVSVKVCNLLSAVVIDIIIGIFILNWINSLSPAITDQLFFIMDVIITYLQNLFKWLMGSPAGLKLNHAFNAMLGNFFIYHVNLWGMFLEISKDPLRIIIKIFQYLGMFGITFQASIFADLLSLASFHVYCIYIYAARLYNLQLSGLIALWRLFLGRKHNPLRAVVDSCHYNHHQLFIGTLGFTILLFLLPTTLMYYFVLTVFRLMRLALSGLLSWIQYSIRSFPLYLLILWALKAPSIAGNINIALHQKFSSDAKIVILEVGLATPSLIELISIYNTNVIPVPAMINFGDIISKVCRGKVLNSE